jgi:hypothetical protein
MTQEQVRVFGADGRPAERARARRVARFLRTGEGQAMDARHQLLRLLDELWPGTPRDEQLKRFLTMVEEFEHLGARGLVPVSVRDDGRADGHVSSSVLDVLDNDGVSPGTTSRHVVHNAAQRPITWQWPFGEIVLSTLVRYLGRPPVHDTLGTGARQPPPLPRVVQEGEAPVIRLPPPPQFVVDSHNGTQEVLLPPPPWAAQPEPVVMVPCSKCGKLSRLAASELCEHCNRPLKLPNAEPVPYRRLESSRQSETAALLRALLERKV